MISEKSRFFGSHFPIAFVSLVNGRDVMRDVMKRE